MAGLIDQKDQTHYGVNVTGTANIVKALSNHKETKLAYISAINSDMGGTQYFATKMAAEKNVMRHGNHAIIRPSLLYGEHDHLVTQLLSLSSGFVPAIPKSGFLHPVYMGDFSKVLQKLLGENGQFDVCSYEKLRLGDMLNIVREKQGKGRIRQLPIGLFSLASPMLNALNIISYEQLAMLKYDFFREDTVLYKYVSKPKKFSEFINEYIK
jgi:nucleoside-diphosphate-sugar epimerase